MLEFGAPMLAFFKEFFSGEAKSIVMQISFVMLLFLDQISGRDKSFQGANCLRGAPLPPLWKKASYGRGSFAERIKFLALMVQML